MFTVKMAISIRAENGSDLPPLSRTSPFPAGRKFRSRQDQEQILRWAFLPGEFVCTGNKIKKPDGSEYYELRTLSLEGVIKIAANRQFIVPNPFHSRTGKTKTGKATCKSDSQVKSRRFLVIEFDFRAFEWT